MSLETFILTLALPIVLCRLVEIAEYLCFWLLHLENVEVGEIISNALPSCKILGCPEYGLPISEKSLN